MLLLYKLIKVYTYILLNNYFLSSPPPFYFSSICSAVAVAPLSLSILLYEYIKSSNIIFSIYLD